MLPTTTKPTVDTDGDIDVLICFPKSVSREDFFSSFYDALSQRDDVEDLHVCGS